MYSVKYDYIIYTCIVYMIKYPRYGYINELNDVYSVLDLTDGESVDILGVIGCMRILNTMNSEVVNKYFD